MGVKYWCCVTRYLTADCKCAKPTSYFDALMAMREDDKREREDKEAQQSGPTAEGTGKASA